MLKKLRAKRDPQKANPDIPTLLNALLLYEGTCARDEKKSRTRKGNVLASNVSNKGKCHCCGGILSYDDSKD